MFGGDPSLMEENKKDHMEPMDMSTSMKYKSKEARNFAKVLRNNHLKRTQKRHYNVLIPEASLIIFIKFV